jgi:chemosensory pili system protein ChpA (sensor histidine kinase/response regulator)
MQVTEPDLDLATNDLGPLAWVLDELRKSLESASAALRRFVRDTREARGEDMASVDGGHLRIARQQLHQAVGALEMVGLGAPAHMLRCMESAVQKFVEKPELCTEPAAAKVERAGFALTEYLEGVLNGKAASAVSLFPQYRDTQELAGADRIHPADLWGMEWRWNDPQTPSPSSSKAYDPAVRSRMDQDVLKVMKTGEPQAAHDLARVTLSLAASQTARQPKIFWKIAAAYFEAISLGLLPLDIYVKRAGSRILLQYATLAKGELGVSDRLAQDLVFFCAQAVPAKAGDAPCLDAVRAAWSLGRFPPIDYQTPQYGRFDPLLLSQARKRTVTAKETWSSLSGGDAGKLKGVADQFHQLTDALVKLYPPSSILAQSLNAVVDSVVKSGRPPGAELAMEVATAVLYLEAAFEDLDPSDTKLAERTHRLAERLDTARQGGQPEALEPWMEELYRRVSDRQTMGSVVGELRGTLGELEKLLDQFFRDPREKAPLRDAPTHLSQMRGVLSVLGLDQAAQAVLRMRDSVEEIIVTEIDEERVRTAGTFEKLGNNLGALGFLIDMLNYQPALAKKLFVYDDSTGELRPLMGRVTHHAPEPDAVGGSEATQAIAAVSAADAAPEPFAISFDIESVEAVPQPAAAAPAVPTKPAPVAAPAPAATADDEFEEDDLQDIFLEEAREVVQNGLAAIEALGADPKDVSELTTLRRAFHTLKGSSRMVGLTEFGEAAWSMEQVLNTWLADQKPASDDLCALSRDAMRGFGRWVEDIAAGSDQAWKSTMFRGPADIMRTELRVVPFALPAGVQESVAIEVTPEPAPVAETPLAATVSIPATPPATLPQFESTMTLRAEASADAPAQFAATVAFQGEPAPKAPDEALAFDFPADFAVELPGGPTPSVDAADFGKTLVIRGEPSEAAEIPAHELPADFEFDASPTVVVGNAPSPVTGPLEIAGIDFDSLAAVSGLPSVEPANDATLAQPTRASGVEVSTTEPVIDLADFGLGDISHQGTSAADEHIVESIELSESLEVATPIDDQIKAIGSLRIGIPLYNVYLNEADEWSRRLATEVAEWTLEMHHRVQDSTVGLAHALAGSSATVGFHALSDIARALESALMHAQMLAYGAPEHAKAFTNAAEEIRRLLHQFAAGFLKEPDPGVIRGLQALEQIEIPQRADLPDDDSFGDLVRAESADSDISATDEALSAWSMPASAPAPVAPAVEARPAPEARPQPMVAASLAAAVPVMASAQVSRAAQILEREQDEIDVADAIDADLFPIFEEEAIELMPQLGGSMRQWSDRPGDRGARDMVLRALHTLKGSARLAGALRLGELAHRMESEIEQLGSESFVAADLQALLHRFDGMQATFDALRATGGLAPAPGAEIAVTPVEPSAASTLVQPVGTAPAQPATAMPIGDVAPKRTMLAMPATTSLAPQRAAANQAVRVRSQLLDRLVTQAGEVMITRSRLEAELRQLRGSLTDLTGNLDRLRSQLRDIELQAESQMQSRLAQAKDSAAGFDPLEFDRFTRVQELTRMMAESVNDVATVQRNLQRTVESTEDDLIAQARQTRELQRDLLRTRMVEFEGISDRLYRVIRLASKEAGKQVKLDITGGSIEMDRGVLDRMTPAFEHLLRNCVAHGIEDPAVRTNAGKDATGTILISLRQEGNDVSVEFKDDGAGLNLPRIREKAQQQGMIVPGQELSDAEASNLIFMPGFSTAAQVTELAGRGIGMDVVRAEVNALGGRIEITTAAGQGTGFKLVLPLTTAVTQVVMIRSGDLSVGVPANMVEIVRRAPAKEVQQAYNSGFYEFGGEQLPFYWSGALLQSSARSVAPQSKTLPVVVFRSAAQRVAVHVDEVLGNQEVVVKNLGPQLARLPGLAGMTLLASGAVVLIYNPVALSTVYGEQARLLSADQAQPEVLGAVGAGATGAMAVAMPIVPQIPLVLVVDDSITVRRVTQRLLQREGYRVSMAADGLQALERLADEKPAVVLSDIEMPRMDGFDLARNIRGDARLKDLPIIMITSRIAEKHREHAKELGVDHYLGKPYSEEELLSLVKHYCSNLLAV